MSAPTRQPNLALPLGLVRLLVVLQRVAQTWAETARTLLGTRGLRHIAPFDIYRMKNQGRS
jgi:hypothetical protein